MTNDKGQKNVESVVKFESRAEGIENRAEQKERNEASANFESLSDAVKAQRKKQHESGESGITGKGDKDGTFASAKDILGNFARKDTNKTDAGSEPHKTLQEEKFREKHGDPGLPQGGSSRPRNTEANFGSRPNDVSNQTQSEANQVTLTVKAELWKGNDNSEHKDLAENQSGDSARESANDSIASRTAQINIATDTLLKGAEERFGKENIAKLGIGEGDVGAATSALLLGPDICKMIGPEQSTLVGKQLIVFGIAPAFGVADEASRQFSSENLQKTMHDGSGNFITGTAIGAALERLHPAILFSALAGGVTAITNEQLNSPENRTRNAELAQIKGLSSIWMDFERRLQAVK